MIVWHQSKSNLLAHSNYGQFIFLSQETPEVPDIAIVTHWLDSSLPAPLGRTSVMQLLVGGSFHQIFTSTTAAPATPALAKARSVNRFVFYGISRRVN